MTNICLPFVTTPCKHLDFSGTKNVLSESLKIKGNGETGARKHRITFNIQIQH